MTAVSTWKRFRIILCVAFLLSPPFTFGNDEHKIEVNEVGQNVTSSIPESDEEVITSTVDNKTEVEGNVNDNSVVNDPVVTNIAELGESDITPVRVPDPIPPPAKRHPKEADFLKINYASKDKGADVLESSEEAKGAGALIIKDKDKYCRTLCEVKLYVVIQLSEDITMEKFVLANYEQFSSTVKDFQVFGSLSYPTSDWKLLGNFTARAGQGDQQFALRSTVRYLKFSFLNFHGLEYYCTLSQIRVHGTTLLAAAQEDLQHHALELEEIHALLGDNNDGDEEEEGMEVDDREYRDGDGNHEKEDEQDEIEDTENREETGEGESLSEDGIVDLSDKRKTEEESSPTDSESDPIETGREIDDPESINQVSPDVGDVDEMLPLPINTTGISNHTVKNTSIPALNETILESCDVSPEEGREDQSHSMMDVSQTSTETAPQEPSTHQLKQVEAVSSLESVAAASGMKESPQGEALLPESSDSNHGLFQRAIGRLIGHGAHERDVLLVNGSIVLNETNHTNNTIDTISAKNGINETTAVLNTSDSLLNQTKQDEKGEVNASNHTVNSTIDDSIQSPNSSTEPIAPNSQSNSSTHEHKRNSTEVKKQNKTPTPLKNASKGVNTHEATVSASSTVKQDKRVDACLDGLNFSKFKERVHAKVAAAKGASKSGGKDDGSQQDRIFKTMMDMIKSLEIGSSIFELYVMKLHQCYSAILEDMSAQHDLLVLSMKQSNHTVNTSLQTMQSDLDRYTPAGYAYRAQINVVQEKVKKSEHQIRLMWFACALCSISFFVSICMCAALQKQNSQYHEMSKRLEELSQAVSTATTSPAPPSTPPRNTHRTHIPNNGDSLAFPPLSPDTRLKQKQETSSVGRWGRRRSSPHVKEAAFQYSQSDGKRVRSYSQVDHGGDSGRALLFASEPRSS